MQIQILCGGISFILGSQQLPTDKIPKTMTEQLHNQNQHTIQQDTVTKNKRSTRWKQKKKINTYGLQTANFNNLKTKKGLFEMLRG